MFPIDGYRPTHLQSQSLSLTKSYKYGSYFCIKSWETRYYMSTDFIEIDWHELIWDLARQLGLTAK